MSINLRWAVARIIAGHDRSTTRREPRLRRLLRYQALEPRELLAVYVVNSAGDGDEPDTAASRGDGVCDTRLDVAEGKLPSAECTLRAAITESNHRPGKDVILFRGIQLIQPLSPLPQITDAVVVDSGDELVELDGSLAGFGNGLTISAGNSTIRGLVINSFPASGIVLIGAGGNTLQHNFIGTDRSGSEPQGNAHHGLFIHSPDNLIGGVVVGEGNVISANGFDGLQISEAGSGTSVQANYIGTDASGTKSLANGGYGIRARASNLTIGAPQSGGGNVISANGYGGVIIVGSETNRSVASHNVIQGNFIGTDVTGTKDLGDAGDGIRLGPFTSDNTVGGVEPESANVIAGNDGRGIVVGYPESTSMDEKADAYESSILANHIVGGQILSLGADGSFADQGDAGTWTSLYVASQALRFQETGDPAALANVEVGLQAIHRLFEASGMPGVPARFVYADGTPFVPDNDGSFASKDLYTSILMALNTAIPVLPDGSTKQSAIMDLRAIADTLIANDFALVGTNSDLGVRQFLSFNPALTLIEFETLARRDPSLLMDMVEFLADLRDFGGKRWTPPTYDKGILIVLLLVGFMSVTYQDIADHWGDWPYFEERRMRRELFEWIHSNLTRNDYYAMSRFLWSFPVERDADRLYGLFELLGAFHWGGPGLKGDLLLIRRFFDDLFAAPRNVEEILHVFRTHWHEGTGAYMKMLIRTLKEVPDAVPSFIRALAFGLGTEPEELIPRISTSGASGNSIAQISTSLLGPSALAWSWTLASSGVHEDAVEQLKVRIGGAGDLPTVVGAISISSQASDATDRLVNAALAPWSIMSNMLLGENGVILSTERGVASSDASSSDSLAAYLLKTWFQNDRANRAVVKRYTDALPDDFRSLDDVPIIPGRHLLQLHVLSVAARVTGDAHYVQLYEQQKSQLLGAASLWTDAGNDIALHILGEAATYALNVSGTHHLPWIAIYDLLSNEQEAGARDAYAGILHNLFLPIRRDRNAFASSIH